MEAEPIKYGRWLPPDFSEHGHGIDNLIFLLHIVMLLLFVGWGIFYVYCLIKFRRSVHPKAEYKLIKGSASKVVEVAVIVVELCLLFGLSVPIWAEYRTVSKDIKDPVHVRVVAQQFAWNIHYPGADGKFGKTDPSKVSDANPMGRDMDDPDGKDDIEQLNNLYIPVDRDIVLDIQSKDVIHSFFVPILRIKQDAIPGMRIPIHFKAKKTGKIEIACAQLCGNSHFRMRGEVIIQTAEEFDKWASSANVVEEFDEEL